MQAMGDSTGMGHLLAGVAPSRMRGLALLATARAVADEVLRGYGQIFFCGRRRCGLLVLLGTLSAPLVGACGVVAAVAACVTGRALPVREDLTRQGLYACNGALAGLALAVFVGSSPFLWGGVVAAGLLSALVMHGLAGVLATFRLPALSLAFVWTAWLVIPLVRLLDAQVTPPWLLRTALAPVPLSTATLVDTCESLLRILSATTLTPGLISGACSMGAAFLLSRRTGLMLLLATCLGLALAQACVPAESGFVLVTAVNVTMTFLALTCVFLPLRGGGLLAGLLGAGAAALLSRELAPALATSHLPLLVAPFNLATMAVLAWVRNRRSTPVAQPSAALDTPPAALEGAPDRAQTVWDAVLPPVERASPLVRLPFWGAWMVSQGPHGQVTHRGEGGHAWDFVVVDEQRSTHRGLGLYLADYYAFGLPVLAPADGVVVRVVDGVPDNEPSHDNPTDNWGNYAIIDHGNDVCTEISHFQAHSLVVSEGQPVRRGQVLGRCGNSGRSLEPHIHFHVQVGSQSGAPTLPARFAPFATHGAHGSGSGAPREGDVVENHQDLPA